MRIRGSTGLLSVSALPRARLFVSSLCPRSQSSTGDLTEFGISNGELRKGRNVFVFIESGVLSAGASATCTAPVCEGCDAHACPLYILGDGGESEG